jgi:hypothetical protein
MSDENLKVVVRIRPLLHKEISLNKQVSLIYLSENKISTKHKD